MLTRNLSEISVEEDNIMMQNPIPLSANAPEFSPSIDIAIYNDGVPSMMLVSEEDVYNVLHGVEDPLESFPPDATDAAELDEVDSFVDAMATLAVLEDREEAFRANFSFCKKRWEARRAEGLRGRPHPAKFSVDPVQHLTKSATPTHQDVKTLVRFLHARRMLSNEQMNSREKSRIQNHPHKQARNHTRRPIQQPRKMN